MHHPSILYHKKKWNIQPLFPGINNVSGIRSQLVPVLRDALSIGALYGMLSFSLSGFTFPYMGMLTWMKPLCSLFPLRHYYLIYVNEALLGGPIIQSAPFVGMLLSFCVLQFLVGHRLHNALVYQNYPRD